VTDESDHKGLPPARAVPAKDSPSMKPPVGGGHDYTDGRSSWDWTSRFPEEAREHMNCEAYTLIGMLVVALLGAGVCLGLAGQPVSIDLGFAKLWISFRLLAIFCTGSVGGVTFSMKWLIHSVAKGKWHIDRRFWRLMVPMIGGVYACVVMTLFGAGLFAAPPTEQSASMTTTAALAYLVGYFSDGVSGLLSNVANAVFGTLEKK
jgi:hypothetical protein